MARKGSGLCAWRGRGELRRFRKRSGKELEGEASGVEAGLLVSDGGIFQTLRRKKKRVSICLHSLV